MLVQLQWGKQEGHRILRSTQENRQKPVTKMLTENSQGIFGKNYRMSLYCYEYVIKDASHGNVARKYVLGSHHMTANPAKHDPSETRILNHLSREEIEAAAMELPANKRLLLSIQLIASLEEDKEIQNAWIEEAERRADAYERGEMGAVDFEQSIAKARARLATYREKGDNDSQMLPSSDVTRPARAR